MVKRRVRCLLDASERKALDRADTRYVVVACVSGEDAVVAQRNVVKRCVTAIHERLVDGRVDVTCSAVLLLVDLDLQRAIRRR